MRGRRCRGLLSDRAEGICNLFIYFVVVWAALQARSYLHTIWPPSEEFDYGGSGSRMNTPKQYLLALHRTSDRSFFTASHDFFWFIFYLLKIKSSTFVERDCASLNMHILLSRLRFLRFFLSFCSGLDDIKTPRQRNHSEKPAACAVNYDVKRWQLVFGQTQFPPISHFANRDFQFAPITCTPRSILRKGKEWTL